MNAESASPPPSRRLRLGAVIAVALAAGFVAWLLLLRDNENSGSNGGSAPVAASVQDLRGVATSVGHPLYWVGRKGGYAYELTKTPKGNVYIRYLPPGVAVGDGRPLYLSVGTYPWRNAYATVKKMAKKKGAISGKVPNGGLAVIAKGQPKSAYLAFPGVDLEIEVYDPSPKRVRQLAFSGAVQPVQ